MSSIVRKRDERHIVIVPSFSEWLIMIIILVLVIGFVCFIGLVAGPLRYNVEGWITPTIAVSVVIGLPILGAGPERR